MTLVFRKQRAQDRIKGRYSFDWGEDDYAVIDETQGVDETQIGRIYKERGPAGVKWLWSLQAARASSPNRGIVFSNDAATTEISTLSVHVTPVNRIGSSPGQVVGREVKTATG